MTTSYARLATGGISWSLAPRPLGALGSHDFEFTGSPCRQPGPSPLGSHDFEFTGSPRDGSLGSHYHVSQWTSVSSGKRRRATLGGAAAWPGSEERRVGKECRSRWSPY